MPPLIRSNASVGTLGLSLSHSMVSTQIKTTFAQKMSIAPAPGVGYKWRPQQTLAIGEQALRTSITSEAYNRTTSLSALLVCLLRAPFAFSPREQLI